MIIRMLWKSSFLCVILFVTSLHEFNFIKYCLSKVDETYQCKRCEHRPVNELRQSKLNLEFKPMGKYKEGFKAAKIKIKNPARGKLVQFLEPKGIRINWPNGLWMKSLEFNANINKPFSVNVSKGDIWGLFKKISRAGILSYWVYENTNVSFKNEDIIYYWIGMDCDECCFVSFPELDDVHLNRFYYLTGRKVIKYFEELEFEELSYLRFKYSNYSIWNESLRYNLSTRFSIRKTRGFDPRISELLNESVIDMNNDYEDE